MTRRRFPAKALMERLLAFDGRCVDCGHKVGGPAGLEFDHRIPLALGGDDELDNLEPRCRPCHRAKTRADVGHIAKSRRMQQRQAGIKPTRKHPLPGSRASGWKRKLDGTVERRDADG